MRKIREIALVTATALLMTMCPVDMTGSNSKHSGRAGYTVYAAETDSAEYTVASSSDSDKPVEKNGWYNEDGKRFYYSEGEKLKNQLLQINEKNNGKIYKNTYYLSSDGSVDGGLKKVNESLYYFDSSSKTFPGAAVSGWKSVNNKTYYFLSSKKAAVGVTTIGLKKYYFAPDTNVLQGGLKKTTNGYMYFSTKTGVAVVNRLVDSMYFNGEGYAVKRTFVTYNGNDYYIGSNYKAVTGIKKVDNYYYNFDSKGVMKKNVWYQSKSGRYYFGSNGRTVKGLNRISGYTFYFDGNFKIVKNTWKTINGNKYYFGPSSKAYTGLRKIGNYYYYFGAKGVMAKNKFLKISGKKYYFGGNGRAYIGVRRVNGEVYNFSSKGYLTTGIKKVYGRLYLFDENGKVVRRSGWYTSKKGNKYYLKSNGSLVTGYKKIGDDFYFFRETNGRMYKNRWAYAKGYKFYFGKNGKRLTNVESILGPQDSYEIMVNKTTNVVTIYAKDGNKGYTIPVKAFVCSGGDSTPLGTFYIPAKWRWLSLVGNCYGQWNTLITYEESILFHSVYYDEVDADTLSVDAYNKLGTTCSHGCIRLKAGDAKWIYDNCSLGTKITIFESNADGPFPKPSFVKLSSSHTWDPTDPNMAYKCKERGCHKGIAW